MDRLAGPPAGAVRAGARVRFAGLITTPGVAYLTRMRDFVAGVMISASHNPYRDNGIKVFDHSGYKLPDSKEHAIETRIFALLDTGFEPEPVELRVDEGSMPPDVDYLVATMPARL